MGTENKETENKKAFAGVECNVYQAVKNEDAEVFKEVISALIEYDLGNITDVADLPLAARMLLKSVQENMDKRNKKYKAVVERNRSNGKGGGRPKKGLEQQVDELCNGAENPEKPKRTHRVKKGKIKTQRNPVGDKIIDKDNDLKIKDNGSSLKDLDRGMGKECITCVQVVQEFLSGGIKLEEYQQKLPACSQGCEKLQRYLKEPRGSYASGGLGKG